MTETQASTECIWIGNAMLCINCDVLFKVGPQECPACCSKKFMPLVKWIKAVEK